MNIIITGASKGIGNEVTKQLAQSGMHTILAIARDQHKLEHLKNDIKQLNTASSVHILNLDLTKEDSIESIKKFVGKNFSSVDILINNAGDLINKPFSQISRQDMYYLFEINFFSIISLIQGLLSYMGKPQTHIVNIGSMGGFQGSPKFSGLTLYSASKAALANLTETLAEELKPQNIQVNCLALGAIQTEMLEWAFPGHKAPITASQIAPFVADFSLNANQYATGKIFPISLSTP